MSTPHIRYKQYSSDWIESQFDEIISKSSQASAASNLPRVEYEDIVSGHGVLNKNIYNKSSNKSGLLFHPGDVLFGKLRPYLKNILLPDFSGIAVGDFWILQSDELSPHFVYNYVNTKYFQKIANISIGTKMPRADWSLVSESMLYYPDNSDEQDDIGSFLCEIEHYIDRSTIELERLKRIKQASLQTIFPNNGENTPRVRFDGFSKKWGSVRLGEVAKKSLEKNTNKEIGDVFTNSAAKGIISQKDYFDHNIAKLDNTGGYYIVRPDDFVYNPRVSVNAPVGPINRNKLGRVGIVSPLYNVFSVHDINNTFLEYYFKTSYWFSFMRFNGNTGARFDRFSISSQSFFNMPIPVPDEIEQDKIARFFENIDSMISLKGNELQCLMHIKESCLDGMFVKP